MKKSYLIFISLFVLLLTSCRKDGLDASSIFDTSSPARNKFDTWILNNYIIPYNINFQYRYSDNEITQEYNLVPTDYDRAVAMAILVKYLWIEAYNEATGDPSFIKKYCPKLIQLVGSAAYGSGQITLGTAEGGLKITLFNINAMDINHIDINVLNYWYFRTIHHEFAHILHQTKNYPKEFEKINNDYTSDSWVNVSTTQANQMGFVTPYASSEPNEDFVEIIANYVVFGPTNWNTVLSNAGTTGSAKLLQKFNMVKTYLLNEWNIDIDKLQTIVQRRETESSSLDLRNID